MTTIDVLPEHTRYHDTGCELSPSCLHCPFPICHYDADKGHKHHTWTRDLEILRLSNQGVTSKELASRYHTNLRTIYRAITRARNLA